MKFVHPISIVPNETREVNGDQVQVLTDFLNVVQTEN